MNFTSFKNIFKHNNSFNLYIKNDPVLAFSMIEAGYEPGLLENKKFLKNLANVAKKERDFFHYFKKHISYMDDQTFINYFTEHDLSVRCKNEMTIAQNFWNEFLTIKNKPKLVKKIRTQLLKNIEQGGKYAVSIQPETYSHAFHFSSKQWNNYYKYLVNVGNAITLFPIIIDNMDEFIQAKSTILESIHKIYAHLEKHNVRVWADYEGTRIYHAHKKNCELFETNFLKQYINKIENYDTHHLEKALVEKTRNSVIEEKKEAKNTGIIHSGISSEMLDVQKNLIALKESLSYEINSTTTEVLDKIITVYKKLSSYELDIIKQSNIDSLYKDSLSILKKFSLVEEGFRNNKQNANGQTAEQILNTSLMMIAEKMNSYHDEIVDDKITDLSVEQRKIKRKTV